MREQLGGADGAGLPEGEMARAVDAIRSASTLTLACHVHPDGDALGSMLAFHLLCRSNGVMSIASWPDPHVVAPHYRFLPGLDLTVPPSEVPAEPELMVTFDLGSRQRLGCLAANAAAARQVLVLDHHHDNHRFGTINVVWTEAAATAVVVRELARRLDWRLERDVACNLFVGLVTDTGRFRYPNTTPEVFELAAELTSYGIPIPRLIRDLFERHRLEFLRLQEDVLARALIDTERDAVFAWLTIEDLKRHGVEFDETEGLIDHICQVASASVACVAKEAPGEGVRVSLRSVGSVDVGAIATSFGGGGHWFMSGFTTDEPIPQVIEKVRALLG